MSRLLYENDDKKLVEVNFQILSPQSLNTDDIVYTTYEVKDLDEEEIRIMLKELHSRMKSLFPKNRVVVIPMKNGIPELSIKIIDDIQDLIELKE